MSDQLYHTLVTLLEHYQVLIYGVAFLAAFIKSLLVIGLIFPGATLILVLGAAAATTEIHFIGILSLSALGTILGDYFDYWLGQHYGMRWLKKQEGRFFSPKTVDKVSAYFQKYGDKTVLIGHFIPGVKEIIPMIAGASKMPQNVFMVWNIIGGTLWALLWAGTGYLFAHTLTLAETWLHRIGLLLLLGLLVLLLTWTLKQLYPEQKNLFIRILSTLYRATTSFLNKHVKWQHFKQKQPRLSAFLAQRFDAKSFFGLPLTLFSLALLYAVMLFAGVVEDLITSDTLVALDHVVSEFISHYRSSELISVFIWITALGIPQVAGPLFLLALLGSWLYKGRWLTLSLLTSVTGALLFTQLSKWAFQRARPEDAILLESTYAFPSAHATLAVSFYGFLGYIWLRSLTQNRGIPFLLIFITVFAIGFSRVVLNVHYVSDVLAGFLVGFIWLMIGITISEWATAQRYIDWSSPSHKQKWLGLLGAIGVAWTLFYTLHWHPKLAPPPKPFKTTIQAPLHQVLQSQHLIDTQTLFGQPSQPISVAFIVENEGQWIQRLEAAGWHPQPSVLPMLWNQHLNQFTFVYTSPNAEKSTIDILRVWETPWNIKEKPILVGAGQRLTNVYNPWLYQIFPESDSTIQQLTQSLSKQTPQPEICQLTLTAPQIHHTLWGASFFSRGKLTIINLSNQPKLCPQNAQ
ncbi:bifunctional DedA family/phosphatase PAP2 family protein [Galenea microaerophila]